MCFSEEKLKVYLEGIDGMVKVEVEGLHSQIVASAEPRCHTLHTVTSCSSLNLSATNTEFEDLSEISLS